MTGGPIAVIGHVDHGKTALVKALTGAETDRLPEERARGLSITAGYAYARYPFGVVDFIDLPGHENFIRAMVGGASGCAVALLVVSAREGIAAQTVEHLRIAELLGVARTIVALSQCDTVDDAAVQMRLSQIGAALGHTPYPDARVVVCSAKTGAGIDLLHGALADAVQGGAAASNPPFAYLPVDRAFAVEGRGVVVTGTLLGRGMAQDDALTLYPSGQPVTVRGLHCRGAPCARVEAGVRVAVNLRGVAADAVGQGDVLCAGDTAPALAWDVKYTRLRDARPLRHMDRVRVLVGTTSRVARVRLMEPANTGTEGMARLHFETPQIAFAGQRGVLRHLSPAQTCGGFVVLDPCAPEVRLRDRRAVLEAVAEQNPAAIVRAVQGEIALRDLARLARMDVRDVVATRAADCVLLDAQTVAARNWLEGIEATLVERVAAYHLAHPARIAMPSGQFDVPDRTRIYVQERLIEQGRMRREGEGLALSTFDALAQLDAAHRTRLHTLEDALRQGGMQPPDLSQTGGLETDLVNLLIWQGRAVRLHNVALDQWIVFHVEALAEARAQLALAYPPPMTFRTGAARATLGTSRKFIVPVLEHFDGAGVTLREGALRRMAR